MPKIFNKGNIMKQIALGVIISVVMIFFEDVEFLIFPSP